MRRVLAYQLYVQAPPQGFGSSPFCANQQECFSVHLVAHGGLGLDVQQNVKDKKRAN